MEGSVIGRNVYRVGTKIGSGAFGEVYLGTDLQTNEHVAIKTERVDLQTNEDAAIKMESVDASYSHLCHEIKMESVHAASYSHLCNEYRVYGVLSGGTGFPNVRWFGRDGLGHDILVMDLLGPTLQKLFSFCGHKFSLKTVLMLADQLIDRIEHIHENGFLHRDLKPENFLMGIGQKSNVVHLIDFGLANCFRQPGTFIHIPYKENVDFTGTALYASENSCNGVEQSRRDDMESLGNVLMYFLRGDLPWQDSEQTATSIHSLCESYPNEFASYFHYCRYLGFAERPDYAYLKRSFRDLFLRKGFQYDNMFDWTILEQQMAQSSSAVPRLPLSPIDMAPGVKDCHVVSETLKSTGEREAEISKNTTALGSSLSYARNRNRSTVSYHMQETALVLI